MGVVASTPYEPGAIEIEAQQYRGNRMDVPDGHIRQGRRQKEQCQEPDQQSVLHHVRRRGRRVFQVCATVDHSEPLLIVDSPLPRIPFSIRVFLAWRG